MGTVILWAAICAAAIVVVNFSLRVAARVNRDDEAFRLYGQSHLWAVVLLSIAISVAVYVVFNSQTSAIVGETNTFRIIEYFLSTPSFRNAAFGIAISILSWWWIAAQTRLGRRQSADEPVSAPRFIINAPLLLLMLTALLAVITAELPAVLGAYRITFGVDGVTLETASYNRYTGETRGGSHSYAGRDSEPTDLPTLGLLRWVVGYPNDPNDKSLFDRDIRYICSLSSGNFGCAEAEQIMQYKEYASKITTPIFSCMAELSERFNDLTPAHVVRHFVLAYKGVISIENSEMEDRNLRAWQVQRMQSAMLGFGQYLEQYMPFAGDDCNRAHEILVESKIDETALNGFLDLQSDVPYAHISYAILSDFLDDTIGGILMLQQWLDRADVSDSTPTSENLQGIWSRYIARTTQNLLIDRLGNDLLRERVRGYDYGAREIMRIYRPDVLEEIMFEEDYCDGPINDVLVTIYFLSIQESQEDLAYMLRQDDWSKALSVSLLTEYFADAEIHNLADDVARFDRLSRCAGKLFGFNESLRYAVIIQEILGVYNLQYANYLARSTGGIHADGVTAQLCSKATDHLRQAHRMLSRRQHRQEPESGYDEIVAILSTDSAYYSFAKMEKRIGERLMRIREMGGCAA